MDQLGRELHFCNKFSAFNHKTVQVQE